MQQSLDYDDDYYGVLAGTSRNNRASAYNNENERYSDSSRRYKETFNDEPPRIRENAVVSSRVNETNLQNILYNQLVAKDNEEEVNVMGAINKRSGDSAPKVYPIDVYILLDSKYRNPQYNINDKFTFNVSVNPPVKVPGNINVNRQLNNIIEMEILKGFEIPKSDVYLERVSQQIFHEAVLEIPELTAQSFIEYKNKRFHFLFDVTETDTKYILTPKNPKFIFTTPIRTDSLTLKFRFPYEDYTFTNDMLMGTIEYPKTVGFFKTQNVLRVVNKMITVNNKYLLAVGIGTGSCNMAYYDTTSSSNTWYGIDCSSLRGEVNYIYQITNTEYNDPSDTTSAKFIIAGYEPNSTVQTIYLCKLDQVNRIMLMKDGSSIAPFDSRLKCIKQLNGSYFFGLYKNTSGDSVRKLVYVLNSISSFATASAYKSVNVGANYSAVNSFEYLNSNVYIACDLEQNVTGVSPLLYDTFTNISGGTLGSSSISIDASITTSSNTTATFAYQAVKDITAIGSKLMVFGELVSDTMASVSVTESSATVTKYLAPMLLVTFSGSNATVTQLYRDSTLDGDYTKRFENVINVRTGYAYNTTITTTTVTTDSNNNSNTVVKSSTVWVYNQVPTPSTTTSVSNTGSSTVTTTTVTTVNTTQYTTTELLSTSYGLYSDVYRYRVNKIVVINDSNTTVRCFRLGIFRMYDPISSLSYITNNGNYTIYNSLYTQVYEVYKALYYNDFVVNADNSSSTNRVWKVVGNKRWRMMTLGSLKNMIPKSIAPINTNIDVILTVASHDNVWLIGGTTYGASQITSQGINPLMYYSTDYGNTWAPVKVTTGINIVNVTKIVYNNGVWHAIVKSYANQDAFLLYSTNGIVWSYANLVNNIVNSSKIYFACGRISIDYCNNKWICGGAASSNGFNMITSTDGINWTMSQNTSLTSIVSVATYNDIWYLGGYTYPGSTTMQRLVTSIDGGNTWSYISTILLNDDLTDVNNALNMTIHQLYVNGNINVAIFRCVPSASTNPKYITYGYFTVGYSYDLTTWYLASNVVINDHSDHFPVLYNDGVTWAISAIGANGGYYYSNDGKVWTKDTVSYVTSTCIGGKKVTDNVVIVTDTAHGLNNSDYVSIEDFPDGLMNNVNYHYPLSVINDTTLSVSNITFTDSFYSLISRPADAEDIPTTIEASISSSKNNIYDAGKLVLNVAASGYFANGDTAYITAVTGLDDALLASTLGATYSGDSITYNGIQYRRPSVIQALLCRSQGWNISDVTSYDVFITLQDAIFTSDIIATLKVLNVSISINIKQSVIEQLSTKQSSVNMHVGTRSMRIPIRFRCLTTAPTNYITPV